MANPRVASDLSILNPNPQRLPGPNNLHHLVATDGFNGAPAIEYLSTEGQTERLTYQQLHERADTLARILKSRWRSGTATQHQQRIVPVYVQQCPLLYIAELAILKAGAAFCPISLDVPEDRLGFILHDVQATLLLTTAQLREKLPQLDSVSAIAVDDFNFDGDSEQLPDHIDPAQPAYIMYTSGSTGQPKGVVISHSAVTQALLAHERQIPEFSRFLQFASPTFDVSVFEIFFPLFRGRTLICSDRRRLLNDLPGFINTMHVDAAELTPSVASSLLRDREQVPTLKLLLTIGEMLKRDVIDEYGHSSHEKSILYGMYGPTEAVIHCTLQPTFTSDMPIGNIGTPLDTVSAFIVKPLPEDGSLTTEAEILSIGDEGELAVGGYQLADGYLNRSEQTKASFITHPQYGTLYRTGDRVRLTKAGLLECSGRISSGQVKLRGQRIELGEIEYAAKKTPGCRTVVADIVSGSLIVFCVFDSSNPTQSSVLEICRKWLPAFMVPADVVIVDELPYLDSGKVDRKALHRMYESCTISTNGHIEVESDRLRTIVEVISDVLRTNIDQKTHLTAAGMDSLSCIRITSHLRRAGLNQLDATTILESRTPRDIEVELKRLDTIEVDRDGQTKSSRRFPDLSSTVLKERILGDQIDEIEHVFPSTAVQSSMLAETAKDPYAYCNWVEFEIKKHLPIDEVRLAVRRVASIHSLLRSGFIAMDGWRTSYAVVLWKGLSSSQLQLVENFDYEFSISDEHDLLRPCKFQIKPCERGIRILLQIHHAQYDQWSLDVFQADLRDILLDQQTPTRQSFDSVSNFHFKNRELARSEDELDFWYDHLRGFTATHLPAIIGRRVPSAQQRSRWFDMDCDLEQMRGTAKALHCSVSALFQSAMAYLIGSYVGSTDVTFGVVFSGRHIPLDGIEGVFGPCLTTLPMRLDYSTTRTCAELVRLVQSRSRAMQKHSLTPLADIKGLFKDVAKEPLFDVLFVWQETTLKSHRDEKSVCQADSADRHEYNLVLEFEPTSDRVRARATFQQALIPPELIDHIISQIQHYVDHIVGNPDSLVDDLGDCLPVATLSITNPEPKDYAQGYNLLNAIERHANTIPSAPALIFANDINNTQLSSQTLTYLEINDRSNRMARFIRSRQDSCLSVCIYMEKSVDLYIAILAAIKAGSGYLPLVQDTPRARVRSIMQQANVTFCLCDSATYIQLDSVQYIDAVDVTQLELSKFEAGNLDLEFPQEQVAYTVFTSGSTGEPKGVPVTMKNLLGNLRALTELYPVAHGDRLLQACSHAFDVSVFEIFFALYNGICLCSATKDVLFQDIESSIRAFEVTHLSLTPTVAALVDPLAVPSVRFLVTAGEAVTDVVHERWAGSGLNQGYGPSETVNICSVNMNVSPDDALGNIGPPLRNTSAFVISPDSDFKILPRGAFGELAFGGEQVFPGYVNRADLNKTKIIHHPRYGRIYRSGDLGRILHDGSMLISGRSDDQVKIRGNRVELTEISALLLQDDHVRNCTTVIVGEDASQQSIASFVILHDVAEEKHPNTVRKDIINHLFEILEESLPSYMTPATISVITEMPRTSQSKLDQKILRHILENQDPSSIETFSRENEDMDDGASWSSLEIRVAKALAETLNIETQNITRRGTVFSFGLNSLNAIAFTKSLSHEFETVVSMRNVLENPSIAKLACIVEKERHHSMINGHAEEQEILPAHVWDYVRSLSLFQESNVDYMLPCTPLQEAMLSTSATSPQATYWNSITLCICGDIQRLKRCWEHMVGRHAILRTRFVGTSDRAYPFVQVVLKPTESPWNEHPEAATNFALEPSPSGEMEVVSLLPFYLNCFGINGGQKLILRMHHAIYDGISISQLLNEVEAYYKDISLHTVPSFREYLHEAKKHYGQDAMGFWSNELRDFMPRPFSERTPIAGHGERTTIKQVSIDAPELNAWCGRHSVSQLAIFQAALIKTLAASQGAEDICIGNVVSGRTVPVDGVEKLVAPCFNTIPVRVQLQSNQTNVELACSLHRKNEEALPYQLTPLRRMQTLSKAPSKRLFDCLFILQPHLRPLDRDIWAIEDESGSMGMPLVFELTPDGERFELAVHYSARYISTTDATCLCDAFSSAISSCLRYPAASVEAFEGYDSSVISGLLASVTGCFEQSDNETKTTAVPDTYKEHAIREVFAQLADMPKETIKPNMSMYQIGLDSLNAPQIARQLGSRGIRVDAGDVLEGLTPALIALRSQNSSATQPGDTIDLNAFDNKHRRQALKQLRVPNDEVESVWPCTPVQSGMLAQSIQSNGGLYINHITYRVPKHLPMNDLHTAWTGLIEKYQILRMGFHKVDNPQFPFAMSIHRKRFAPVPFIERQEKLSVKSAETKAKELIMRSIHNQAWCVQILLQNDQTLMVLSLHHALYDADSLKMILADLPKAISSSNLGNAENIDAELIANINASTRSTTTRSEFWSKALQESVVTKFPDLVPTVTENCGLEHQDHKLSISQGAIEAFCQQSNATIQSLAQTVWATLLASYIGDANIIFGVVFSGGLLQIGNNVAFPSITTIPVPCDTAKSPLEILHDMTRFNASALRHRFTPLAEIQKHTGYENRQLFDTVFVYQKSQIENGAFDWTVVRDTAAVDYAASLELEPGPHQDMSIRLTFRTDRIPPKQARLMLLQYDYLLQCVVSGEVSRPKSLYAMLPAKEPVLPSNVRLLHQFVEHGALEHPDRVALTFVKDLAGTKPSTESWTYKQLDAKANKVANLLWRAGVQPGSIVAVRMVKCPEASFAFIGILKAGCSFLAIDPELPQARLEFILRDSSARLLFVDEGEAHSFEQVEVECMELTAALLAPQSISAVRQVTIEPKPDSTCYCLYTSGTTGTPKGCEITHENAVQAMMSFQRLFAGRWTKDSRWLQFASYWFDVSVLEQFWSWSVGIAVIGAPRDVVLEDLPAFISGYNITHIDLTPALARLVQPNDVPSLWSGVFITGGEALKQEIIDAWGPERAICNGYGPTEATIGVTMNTFIGDDAKPSNIGRQFDNVGTYVLKPGSDEPVLRGCVGELCVSGKLVGKGYLNRPELTARQFPTLAGFNERVYRTGDLVRFLADGSFLFVGRQDSQAKLRGQRLEISEIDNVIQHCADDVAHVVSLIIKAEDGGGETLISFLAINAQKKSDELEVVKCEASLRLVRAAKQACLSQLPGYMVPTHILPVNYLPLTVNNKIDTKRLKALFIESSPKDLQSLSGSETDSSTMTAVEREIGSALSELLSIDLLEVTSLSNMFSLGLSSISAISLSSFLKRRGLKKASVATLMSNPIIKHLAAAIDSGTSNVHEYNDTVEQARLSISAFERRHRGIALRVLGVAVDDIEAMSLCTPLQQGLIIDSTSRLDHPYFNDFVYSLEDVDVARLLEAIRELANRVQILRTKFVHTDNGTAQVVLKKTQSTITHRHMVKSGDLTSLSVDLRLRWIEDNKDELIDPFEAHVLCSDDQCVLVLHIHHALYDGISYGLMINHLMELYQGKPFSGGGPQFIDALAFGPLRQQKHAKRFWQKRLEDITHTTLPALRSATKQECHRAAFDFVEAAALEQVRKAIGVSHQALMQSCFEIALRKCVPSVHIYGLVVSGRSIELAGADRVLGPMFNTLPQPLYVAIDTSLSEYVRLCHDSSVATLPYQHTPLVDIRKWKGRQSASPMFDVLFVFQHAQGNARSTVDKYMREIEKEPQAQYPLACEVEMADNGHISIKIVAQGEFFDQHGVNSILESFNDVLHCLVDDPDAPVGERFAIETAPVTPALQNGAYHERQLNGSKHFAWTQSAEIIRAEIAALTNVATTEVDEHSTIFAFGLDSIDAVRLASRLRKNGLSIPVSKILQAQTIPRMLEIIESDSPSVDHERTHFRLSRMESQLQSTGISSRYTDPDNVETTLPATPAQEGLLAEMFRSELREYFNHDVLRLSPDVDIDRLQEAWRLVIYHTPVLRTLFVEVLDPDIETVFAQVVLKESPLSLVDRRSFSESDMAALFDNIRMEVRENIDQIPPFRLTIVEITDERYLVLSLAHAQYDGHSLALLHRDVERAYHDCFLPRPQYNSVIEAALNAQNEVALQFWKDSLAGVVAHAFPHIGSVHEESQTHRSERRTSIRYSSARLFCKTQGVSMQALAQTCWALTLAHYTKSMESMFGVVLNCRDSKEAEEVVFPTMNTVAVRASLHGTRAQMVQHVQSLGTDMLPYQRTPLRSIQAAVAKANRDDADESPTALFDTIFIYQHKPDSQENLGTLYESVGGSSGTGYPVAVEMEASGDDTLIIRGACRGNVLDRVGTEQLLETVEDVMSATVNSPDEPTVDFDEDRVSICGMDPFYLDDIKARNTIETETAVEEVETRTDNSPITLSIMEAFAQVAKVSTAEISSSTSVDSIGIDSISAIKVAARLRKQDIHLSVSQILHAKTPARMAETLRTKPVVSNTVDQPPSDAISRVIQSYAERDILQKAGIDPIDVETISPATAGQIYMLSMWQKTAGQIFYPTFRYQLDAKPEMEDIQHAWDTVVAHHSILRTIFCATGDINVPALQVILREAPGSFNKEQTFAVNSHQPMVSLQVEKGNTGYLLILSIHHALYDAVSLPLLVHEFQALLAGRSTPNATVKFEEFIAPSVSHRAKQLRKHFWADYLADVHPRNLTQPQHDGQQKKIDIFHPALCDDVSEVETIARKEGLSIQSILFAAYAKVYAGLTSSPADNEGLGDVVLGIYLSNRSHLPNLETLAAPTVNLVPLLVQSAHQRSLLEVARRIQGDLQKIGTEEHSAVGLWEIEQWTGVKVDTFVNFLKLPEADEDGSGEQDQIVIKSLDDKRLGERSQVVEHEDCDGFEVPQALEGMEGVDAYQHSLDIEMTVTDGKLDVGLFCPESMVGLQQAEEALAEFKALLEKFVGKA